MHTRTWSLDADGSGGCGAPASPQPPPTLLPHSQNTAGAPNVYSVARRSRGNTPRWRNMSASSVPKQPPTL